MRLPRGKPDVCVGEDESRPQLEVVYLRGEYLEVTDSYKFVKVKVERTPDDLDGPIPTLAFELAREHGLLIDCSRENHVVLPGLGAINRPALQKEVPTYETIKTEVMNPPAQRISVNTKYLRQIAKAFGGGETVTLEIPAEGEVKAMRVLPLGEDGTEAVLMPVHPQAREKLTTRPEDAQAEANEES